MPFPPTHPVWDEYDSAAEWCARRGLKGEQGDKLPDSLSTDCARAIDFDPEAFQRRIAETGYALAREERPVLSTTPHICTIKNCQAAMWVRHA